MSAVSAILKGYARFIDYKGKWKKNYSIRKKIYYPFLYKNSNVENFISSIHTNKLLKLKIGKISFKRNLRVDNVLLNYQTNKFNDRFKSDEVCIVSNIEFHKRQGNVG